MSIANALAGLLLTVSINLPPYLQIVPHELPEQPKTVIAQPEPEKPAEPTKTKPEPIVYVVKAGDNLDKVAKAHKVSWQRLFDKNTNIKHPDVIHIGDKLTIPVEGEKLTKRELPKPPEPAPVVRQQSTTKPQPVQNSVPYISGCDNLRAALAAHGLTATEQNAAIQIATRESGCRQSAVNPSSGACNVFQELPCGKWGGSGNLAAHIAGADNYAKGRYGGWVQAYNAWLSKHWW